LNLVHSTVVPAASSLHPRDGKASRAQRATPLPRACPSLAGRVAEARRLGAICGHVRVAGGPRQP